MFRLWAKEFKDNRMLRDTVICDDSDETRTQLITEGPLENITQIKIRGVRTDAGDRTPTEITLIPYYTWNSRGDNQTMRVWIPDLGEKSEY